MLSDLIGYAVAWSGCDGAVHLGGQARVRWEAEVLLAAAKLEATSLKHFIVEIYPDSAAVPAETETAPEKEVTA